MFEIGKIIVHRDHGLCKISGVEHVSYVDKDYFILYPINDDSTKIMVPCDGIDCLCREVISKEDCLNLIDSLNDLDGSFIQDNKKRKEEYAKLLKSNRLIDIAHLMKMLNSLFKEKRESNKMIGLIDNALYKEAREKLYSEIGYVLGIDSYDEIENLIKSKLNFC